MLYRHLTLLFSFSILSIAFTGCKSMRSEENSHEKILPTIASNNSGKIIEPGSKPYRIGDYIRVKEKHPVWRREIGNFVESMTWEKVGKPQIINHHPVQKYRRVDHFQIILADMEYVYCRQILAVDHLNGEPICMPPGLKKTWMMKNASIVKILDCNTNFFSSGIGYGRHGLGLPQQPPTCPKPGCKDGKDCPLSLERFPKEKQAQIKARMNKIFGTPRTSLKLLEEQE